jgi:hypothetical protein
VKGQRIDAAYDMILYYIIVQNEWYFLFIGRVERRFGFIGKDIKERTKEGS